MIALIGERTRVVAVPNVHWTDGSLVDLDAVIPAARRVGAAVVIDASQSLGALPLEVARLRPDFVVSVGYKWLLGPLGVGCLYVNERHRDGEPIEENWINREGAEDFSALVTTPRPTAPAPVASMWVRARTSGSYRWRSRPPNSCSRGRFRRLR